MKDLRLVKFNDFIEIANEFETPLKVYKIEYSKTDAHVEARCFLRTFMVSWMAEIETKLTKFHEDELIKNDFKEGRIEETKLLEMD